ncbi:hypothetical protein EDB80DRAFT_717296 [Ilyonectria destructans]|nr:hypothetical protein EDB80DRAFT_717296 [Ilyonectria destructans]
MRENLHIKAPGCNICLLGTPIHALSCGHQLCNYCITALRDKSRSPSGDEICILCDKHNEVALNIRPPAAGIRTLELLSSAESPLRFLHEVRKLLSGHLADRLICGTD